MIKKNLKKLLLTSAVILLPVLAGLLLWDRLPDTINIHWGAEGQADGTAGKAFAVFAPSLFILATHWLCVLVTAADPKNKNQTPKALGITLWICPVLSVCVSSLVYSAALGLDFNMNMLFFVPMGILFAVMGNYMPKFRPNSTMGIKTTWALADEENWNATHRFSGKVWMGGGLLIILLSCLPWAWAAGLVFLVLFAACFAPIFYSWQFYRKKKAAGVEVPVFRSRCGKWVGVFTAALVIFLFVILFTGNIEYRFGDTALTVDADRWDGITVAYADIDDLEYREEMVSGSREWGYGSARLLLGSFRNEEFGNFTRYTYSGADCCVVLTVGEKTLVLSGQDEAATKDLYRQLLDRVG